MKKRRRFTPAFKKKVVLAGMIIFASIVGLLMKVIDGFSSGEKPPWFFLAIVAMPVVSFFTNSALFTTLLTGGLGPAILLCWFLYEKKRGKI